LGSKLDKDWRLASHNEYLRIAVLYGIPGIAFFIFSLFYPLIHRNKKKDILFLAFLYIVVCSMFTEDTLETQTGVTFFAFLYSLLLFQGKVVVKHPLEEKIESK
jgi:O-antigen ligase